MDVYYTDFCFLGSDQTDKRQKYEKMKLNCSDPQNGILDIDVIWEAPRTHK